MNVETNSNLQCTLALSALQNVYDPEIGLNVADLGLIYKLMFDEAAQTVNCIMTLTTQFCPMGELITTNVKQELENTFAGQAVDVQLVFEPAWSYDRISEEGKAFLER